MAAAVRRSYGSIDRVHVEQVPTPVVTHGRVLVRVDAAGLDRGVLQQSGTPMEVYAKPRNRFVAGFTLLGLGLALVGVAIALGG